MNNYENFITMLKESVFNYEEYLKDERECVKILFDDEPLYFIFNSETHRLIDIYS